MAHPKGDNHEPLFSPVDKTSLHTSGPSVLGLEWVWRPTHLQLLQRKKGEHGENCIFSTCGEWHSVTAVFTFGGWT